MNIPRLTPQALLVLLLAACATTPPNGRGITLGAGGLATDAHVPAFARRPFEPFSRENVVAIAQREWRAFGMPVNDDPPDQQNPHGDSRLDRQPGLWQRVGEYWWLGQNAGGKEEDWSSKYSEYGTPYRGDAPAWSAAFISYVMRSAGAAGNFTYSPLHADYINAAARNEGALRAERPENYAPRPGDLICTGRASARNIRFEDLPASTFLAHCDIVTQAGPSQLLVIGGNVDAGVTMKHIPTGPTGLLAEPGGRPYDSRYNWFVVLRVMYDGIV